MSKTRIIGGSYTKIIGKDYNLYSEENTNIEALQKNNFVAGNQIIYGSEVEAFPEYQPDNTIILYIGMFFDGTGNNRYNSDSLYYTKVKRNSDKIKSSEIPPQKSFTNTSNNKGGIKITDRDSYWNPYSNIAKLYDLYKVKTIPSKDNKDDNNGYPNFGYHAIFKQYVEGIGTERGKEDDTRGSSVGRGELGILAKVEKGIKDLVNNELNSLPKNKQIYKIVFDVFGFSRGAAAARHFCNEVKSQAQYVSKRKKDYYNSKTDEKELTKHAGGMLGAELNKIGLKPYDETYKIEIRFLGLFDTVISDLIVKDIGIVTQKFLEDIKTNISGLRIGKVFHIQAYDEWRENFAFTPTEEGYTLKMLGAHSDIGGGYAELDYYTNILDFFDIKDEENDKEILKSKENLRKYFINNYYCQEDEIKIDKEYHTISFSIESSPIETHTYTYKEKVPTHYILKAKRYISNKYSLVPMNIMLQKAIEKGVPFYENYEEAIKYGEKIKYPFEYEITDNELEKYLKYMLEISKDEKGRTYTIPKDMLKHIRNKYVHLSAHYGGIHIAGHRSGDHHFTGDLLFINRPVKYQEDENGDIKYNREIYHSIDKSN